MQGNAEEAERLLQQVLAIRLKLFPEMHPAVASSYSMLATVRWKRGDLDAALPLLEKAVGIIRQVLGVAHRATETFEGRLRLLQQRLPCPLPPGSLRWA